MDTVLHLILQVALWPRVPAFFIVEVTKLSHHAEFQGNVTMECTFRPVDSERTVSVFWRRVLPDPPMEVYGLDHGQEDLSSQDSHYRGRVQLMREELRNGRAVLRISSLRINDSGMYQCLVEMGGTDYKHTALSVRASYKSIHKSIKRIRKEEAELSCQSQGYPQVNVVWTDGTGRNITKESNVTVITFNQLFHITSTVIVNISNNTYTCTFVEEGLTRQSDLFHIPEDIPEEPTRKGSLVPLMFAMFFGIIAICVGIMVYFRQKGSKRHIVAGARDCLLQENYAPACLHQETTMEVQTCVEENRVGVENLREVLKKRYAALISDMVAEQHMHFCDKVLPRCLRNSDGLALGVTALLPEVGETIVLEGEPKSGKTCVALSLASAWAHSEWDLFGIQHCQVVVLVTCEGVTGDLFQEVMSQLGLEGELTVYTLREILSGPVEALLVLDGYRFGNRELDESLKEFLKERQTCRVLMTTLPGQCGHLTGFIRTVLVLHRKEDQGRC